MCLLVCHCFSFSCTFLPSAVLKWSQICLTWGVFDLTFRSSETERKYWLSKWDKSSTPRFPCPPKTWSNILVFACVDFSLLALCVWYQCFYRLCLRLWCAVVLLPCYYAAALVTSTLLLWTPQSTFALRAVLLFCEKKCWCIELDIFFVLLLS